MPKETEINQITLFEHIQRAKDNRLCVAFLACYQAFLIDPYSAMEALAKIIEGFAGSSEVLKINAAMRAWQRLICTGCSMNLRMEKKNDNES